MIFPSSLLFLLENYHMPLGEIDTEQIKQAYACVKTVPMTLLFIHFTTQKSAPISFQRHPNSNPQPIKNKKNSPSQTNKENGDYSFLKAESSAATPFHTATFSEKTLFQPQTHSY